MPTKKTDGDDTMNPGDFKARRQVSDLPVSEPDTEPAEAEPVRRKSFDPTLDPAPAGTDPKGNPEG